MVEVARDDARKPVRAHRARGLTVASAFLLCLPACSVFRTSTSREHLRDLDITPTCATWIVAEICRLEFPGADPDPNHGDCAAIRLGPERYGVRYARPSGRVYRAYRNGRISPPNGADLGDCRFHPASNLTGSAAAAISDQVLVEITSHPGGCRIRIRARGAPANSRLIDRLDRALSLTANTARCARLIARGAFEQADTLAATSLASANTIDRPEFGILVARLYYYRARSAEARGDLAAVHGQLTRSLARDDGFELARRLHAKTCERFATPGLRRSGPPARFRDADLTRARHYLQVGDLVAATHWAHRAIASAPDDTAPHRVLAQVFCRLNQPHRAITEELIVLERRGFDADGVLRIASLYDRSDNPAAGVRMMARHLDELWAQHRAKTRAVLLHLLDDMPRRLAWRILASSDPGIATALLGKCVGETCARAAGLRHHPRNRDDPTLLLAGSSALPELVENGYRNAPGVTGPEPSTFSGPPR